MLYDDERQLEVRYVVSLEYHDVDVYAGGGEMPESELWIKRNCIRLTRRETHATKDPASSRPFYLFSENQSQKEDFYFALLNNLTKGPGAGPPAAQEFSTPHIISLVQRLHSTEEHMQTRWLNAMLGRYFLAMYKTPELEALIRTKLLKKMARVKKPSFVTRLELQKIDMGNGAPFVTNPRLKDLDVNGNCVMEADIEYTGGFRVELGATLRIDLGTRLKAREVDIVLAATCESLQGHLLVKFKPPPSNRIWITFEKLPKIDMSLEPIVSSRQITYTFILKQIEHRILEVVAETIVLPFWDDIPFSDTTEEKYRGGIWKKTAQPTLPTEIKDEVVADEADAAAAAEVETATGEDYNEIERAEKPSRTSTTPDLSRAGVSERTTSKKATQSLKDFSVSDAGRSPTRRDAPRMLRSPSFATTVDPMVSPSHAPAESSTMTPEAASKRDSMLQRSLGTPSDSGTTTPQPPSESAFPGPERRRAESTASQIPEITRDDMSQHAHVARQNSDDTTSTEPSTRTKSLHKKTNSLESTRNALQDDWKKLSGSEQAQKTMASIASAREVAQKWGWGVLSRNRAGTDGQPGSGMEGKLDLSQPLGRGQPLPPPGQPLPRPPKGPVFALPSLPKRKVTVPSQGIAAPTSSSHDTGSPASIVTPTRPHHDREPVADVPSPSHEEDKTRPTDLVSIEDISSELSSGGAEASVTVGNTQEDDQDEKKGPIPHRQDNVANSVDRGDHL